MKNVNKLFLFFGLYSFVLNGMVNPSLTLSYVSDSHRKVAQKAQSADGSYGEFASTLSDLQNKYESRRRDLELDLYDTDLSSSKKRSTQGKLDNVKKVLDKAIELKDSVSALQNRVDFLTVNPDGLGQMIQDGSISKSDLAKINDAIDLLKRLSKQDRVRSGDITSLNSKVTKAEQTLKQINDKIQQRVEKNDNSRYLSEQKEQFEKSVNESDPRSLSSGQYPELIQESFDKFSNYKTALQSFKENRTTLKMILNDNPQNFNELGQKINKVATRLDSSLKGLETMNSTLLEIQKLINNNPSKIHAFDLASQLQTLERENVDIDPALKEQAQKVIEYYAKMGEKISDVANKFVFGSEGSSGAIDLSFSLEKLLERSQKTIKATKQKLTEAQKAKKSLESFDQTQAKKNFDDLGKELVENLQRQAELPEDSSELDALKAREKGIKQQMQEPITDKEFITSVEESLGSLYDDSFEDLGITDDQGSGVDHGSTGGDRGGFGSDRTVYDGEGYYHPEGEFRGF